MRRQQVPATSTAEGHFFSGLGAALALSVPFWIALVALLR